MIKKVEAYEAEDGTLCKTEAEALSKNRSIAIQRRKDNIALLLTDIYIKDIEAHSKYFPREERFISYALNTILDTDMSWALLSVLVNHFDEIKEVWENNSV